MPRAVAQIPAEPEQFPASERTGRRCANRERLPVSDELTDNDFAAPAAAMFRTFGEEEPPRA